MKKASRAFQIFAKPIGPVCNLDCHYCYYLKKESLYNKGASVRMNDEVLKAYIVQYMQAYPEPEIHFTWHGGEPTMLGLDYFRKIVELQQRFKPAGSKVVNCIQTNGTLLDENLCRYFSDEGFIVGLSMDGPEDIHNFCRVTKTQAPTYRLVIRGYDLLQKYNIPCDILCTVNAHNVNYPLQVYRFFKEINARYIGFLPIVEHQPGKLNDVSSLTVPSDALGKFYSIIFDEWKQKDIGRIIVQNFEEVAKVALNQEHALCIFRPTCGDFPVVEHNGDFYTCDHFVDEDHCLGNILKIPLINLLESASQKAFGQNKLTTLTNYCLKCDFLGLCNGGCPKDRFIKTPDGEDGLNYLCDGYKYFFLHCQPFIKALSEQWQLQKQNRSKNIPEKIGRNSLCPCGSGRKYKKCCMGA